MKTIATFIPAAILICLFIGLVALATYVLGAIAVVVSVVRSVLPSRLALSAVMIGALASAGCGLPPLLQASVAADSLTATQTGIREAWKAGILSDEELLAAEPIDKAARAAVAKMFERAEAGEPDIWPSGYWQAAREFWETLAELKSIHSTASRRPATLPSVDEPPLLPVQP